VFGTMPGRRRGPRRRLAVLSALVAISVCALCEPAGATVQVTNQNDPAGDPTVVGYRLTPPAGPPIDFSLRDGESRGFGPFDGPVVVEARFPSGWEARDIQCIGFNPVDSASPTARAFTIDKANGRVTMQHTPDDEQFCAFTNGKASASQGGSPGVSPAPPPNLAPGFAAPTRPTLLAVKARRGYAVATVHIVRRSVIASRLVWHGHVVGTSRVVRDAGTYDVTVSILPSTRRRLKARGLKRVTLTLRCAVVGANKAAYVFRPRVLVPL
jgi:hypothetical protein